MIVSNALSLLTLALERRADTISSLAERDTNVFRLVNSTADGLPGLSVDRVGDVLLVEQHRHEADVDAIVSALKHRYPRNSVFVKQRWSPDEALRRGTFTYNPTSQSPKMVARENGLQFDIQLDGDEHIGLFVDSRDVREQVARLSVGHRVLNLFSYTCAFGVYAQQAGARSTVNIDNKASALRRGERNYALNGLPCDSRTFFKCDATDFLKRAAKQKGRYDLIVVDPPPAFKRKKRRDFLTHRDYGYLLKLVEKVAADQCIVLAGLNALKARDSDIEVFLGDAQPSRGRWEVLSVLGAGADFPVSPDRPAARFWMLKMHRNKGKTD